MNDKKTLQKKAISTTQTDTMQRASTSDKGQDSASPLIQLREKIGNQGTMQLMSQTGASSSSKSFGSLIQQMEEDELQMQTDDEELLQGQMEEDELQMQPEDEELIQGQMEEDEMQMQPEDEEVLQGKKSDSLQLAENKTGLPDNLKTGIENLSGSSMSDVRVHPNSSKPAEVGALAYTQGTDIHVAPGQEQHLPHEAWHVAQQKQGRVQPTTEVAGLPLNDDKGLEQEATDMGQKAMQMKQDDSVSQPKQLKDDSVASGGVVQGWLPLGHVEISKKILNEGTNKEDFPADVKDYLVDRSPDMDFIQDETTAMDGGGAEGKANIETFYQLLGRKKNGASKWFGSSPSPEDIEKAKKMWNTNELHKREKWYMTHHGEAGFYKDDMSTASAKNYAVTNELVDTAIAQYNAGKKTQAFSILSDALHQAADRGAHEEGAVFKGHDSRIGIKPEAIKSITEKKTWPDGWVGGEDVVKGEKADPDNAGKNPEGAKYGLYHVNEALKRFKAGVVGPITFEEGVDSTSIEKRNSKIAGVTGTSNSKLGKLGTTLIGMSTDKDSITGVKKEEWSGIMESGSRPKMKEELTEEQQADVQLGLSAYDQIFIVAEVVKELTKTKPRFDSKEKSAKRVDAAYETVMTTFPEFTKEQSEPIAKKIKDRALANYNFQRGQEKPEHLKDADVSKVD